MRPIKFRAWTGTEMRYDIVGIDWDESFEVHNAWLGNNIEYNADNFLMNVILMQYTGLLDKNGVEIYEGDVVAYTDKQGQKKIGKINYANAKYYIGNFETLGYASERYELEVIGNKFEHPELLEESK